MTVNPSLIDLNDPGVFADGQHHEVFDWLRANDPVHWQEPAGDLPGFWSLTRFDDVTQAYRDHAVFSSAAGVMLGGSVRNQVDTASGKMLVASDLPRHRLLRREMHGVFAARIGQRVARQVADLLHPALRRAEADGGCDFAAAVATCLPAGALMAMVGISLEQAHYLIGQTHAMIGFRDPAVAGVPGDDRLRLAGIQAEIFDFFTDLIAERRHDPGDDLIGILLRAEVNGRPLPEETILYNCLNIAVGGNETTPYTACGGMLALIGAPGEYGRLLGQPQLAEQALAEIVRISSVNAYTHRITTADVTVRGRVIQAGQSVALWNAAANRDPSEFRDPHQFDLTRTPNRHIAFGAGIHRCIGARFGLIELGELFRELSVSGLRFELAGDVVRLRSNFMLGIRSMPVRVTGKGR
jgi:cytochrome P450